MAGEKRKQKLALLDEILRTEPRDSSSPSVPDDTEEFGSNLSLPPTRHSSHSPVQSTDNMTAFSSASDPTTQAWRYPAYEQRSHHESDWYSADGFLGGAEGYTSTAADTPSHSYDAASNQYFPPPDLATSPCTSSSVAGHARHSDQHLSGLSYVDPSIPCNDDFSYESRNSFYEQNPSLPVSYGDATATLHHSNSASRSARSKSNMHYNYDSYYPNISSPGEIHTSS